MGQGRPSPAVVERMQGCLGRQSRPPEVLLSWGDGKMVDWVLGALSRLVTSNQGRVGHGGKVFTQEMNLVADGLGPCVYSVAPRVIDGLVVLICHSLPAPVY